MMLTSNLIKMQPNIIPDVTLAKDSLFFLFVSSNLKVKINYGGLYVRHD